MSNYNHYSSVTDMLTVLNWYTLQNRRNTLSLCIMFKLTNGMVEISLPPCIVPTHTSTRGHNNKFVLISFRVDAYKYSKSVISVECITRLHSECTHLYVHLSNLQY